MPKKVSETGLKRAKEVPELGEKITLMLESTLNLNIKTLTVEGSSDATYLTCVAMEYS